MHKYAGNVQFCAQNKQVCCVLYANLAIIYKKYAQNAYI